ncbi:hypothetical protein ACJX0J_009793, partial [Zea mays]
MIVRDIPCLYMFTQYLTPRKQDREDPKSLHVCCHYLFLFAFTIVHRWLRLLSSTLMFFGSLLFGFYVQAYFQIIVQLFYYQEFILPTFSILFLNCVVVLFPRKSFQTATDEINIFVHNLLASKATGVLPEFLAIKILLLLNLHNKDNYEKHTKSLAFNYLSMLPNGAGTTQTAMDTSQL